MKKLQFPVFFLTLVLGLTACSDSEDPKPEDESFAYYFKFKAENREYFFGFNEIGDRFNPKEEYQGDVTDNFIIYNSGVLFSLVTDFCGDQPNRDCLHVVFAVDENSVGTFQASRIDIIGSGHARYVPFLSERQDGSLTITINKIDPIGRYIEASFSGQLYNETTREEVLKPITGEFRAYYNPD